MDKRLRELMIQAMTETGRLMDVQATYQRFGELIIRECANVAHKCIDDEWFDVGGAIKEHFGLDE